MTATAMASLRQSRHRAAGESSALSIGERDLARRNDAV